MTEIIHGILPANAAKTVGAGIFFQDVLLLKAWYIAPRILQEKRPYPID